ncbi:MAG: hypothetical protein AB1642_04445 [Pseudomonadota bacterium]
MNRRQLLRQLAAAGLFSAGGAMGFLQRALAAGANPVPPGLHKLKGAVTVNGQPAREGQLILPGDTVATPPDGEAIYVIGDNAFLQRGGSQVSFGTQLGKGAADFMRVLSGRILSVFGRGDKTLRFATATIGIRGTACYIEEGVKAETYFCLCYGSALVTPTAAPHEAETITTSHHDHPLWISDDMKMPSMMVTAPVVNHTDIELEMLENLVGRWPPFHGKVDYHY